MSLTKWIKLFLCWDRSTGTVCANMFPTLVFQIRDTIRSSYEHRYYITASRWPVKALFLLEDVTSEQNVIHDFETISEANQLELEPQSDAQ